MTKKHPKILTQREREAADRKSLEAPIHGIANLWPSMSEDEWSEFVADISANGLIDPIIKWRGSIVDGKHRYRACQETGTKPRFDDLPNEWDEWKVATHCQSKHRRRNLTAGQRAAVAAMAIEKYSQDAQERRIEVGQATGRGKRLAPAGADLSSGGKAASHAAKDMGSSERSVERAVFVQKAAPEVLDLVHSGKLSLKVGERLAKEKDPEKRAAKIAQLDTGAREDDAGDSWGTPPEWIDLARNVMGGIDLDPATNEEAQRVVKAARFYTKDDNGLEQSWSGRVWMNPPYSQPLVSQFAEKLVADIESGNVEQACVLVNNATDARFLQLMLSRCSAALFPKGRIPFLVPGSGEALKGTRQGQTFVYYGKNVAKFIERSRTRMDWGLTVSKGAIRSIEKFAAAAVRRRTERFDHCFPRGITMGDIDSHVEINHHWLFIEYKLGDQTLSNGQRLDLYRLSQRPRMSAWILWTSEDGFITHGQIFGRHDRRIVVTEDAVATKIKEWVTAVEAAPKPQSLDLIADLLDVAAYLDARESYLRIERAKLLNDAIAALRNELGATA